MTVSAVYEDHRKPLLPYAITILYGRMMSLIECHRFPTRTMADLGLVESLQGAEGG